MGAKNPVVRPRNKLATDRSIIGTSSFGWGLSQLFDAMAHRIRELAHLW
jgi:hypothetical protein